MARALRFALALSALSIAACATARNYPDPAGPRFAGEFAGQPRPDAFVHGFHHALETAAGIALAGAVLAALTLRRVQHPEHSEPQHAMAEAA